MASPSPLGLPSGCWRCDGAKVGPCSNQAALPSAPFAAAPEHPRMAQLVPPGTIFLWVECRHLLLGQAALQGKNKPSRGCRSQFVKHYKIFLEKKPKTTQNKPLAIWQVTLLPTVQSQGSKGVLCCPSWPAEPRAVPKGRLGSGCCTEEIPRKEIPKHQRKGCSHDIFWPIQKEKMSGISQENL